MNQVRGGPIFRTGFSILSAKGFLGPHPPIPKSFQRSNKNPSTLITMMSFILTLLFKIYESMSTLIGCSVDLYVLEVFCFNEFHVFEVDGFLKSDNPFEQVFLTDPPT